MISVLIPVFNTDVRNLVSALAGQIEVSKHEIVVLDDGSDQDTLLINENISAIAGVRYYRNGKNRGRIEARHKLASLASAEWLLFLDADSGMLHDHFIEKYVRAIDNASEIVVGGRIYEPSKPLLCKYALHWKYGKSREDAWRSDQDNAKGFQSSNFLIHRSVFNQINFPGEMRGYGHEDTWMGIQLEKLGHKVRHIDNSVLHLRLEPTENFIRKSEEALENLIILQQYCDRKTLSAHVKLYRKYLLLRRTGAVFVLNILYSLSKKTIKKSLYSCDPDLMLFDIYRMHYFIKSL